MIDYGKIAGSVMHYSNLGYERMEAPWWVSKEILDITTPKHVQSVYHLPTNNKCLVASAEQSFLYMAAKGRLPRGKYQAVTPCFRDESIGILHKKCFIKNELISTDVVHPVMLDEMINDALKFFKLYVPDHNLLWVTPTGPDSRDIMYGKIELGSYGIRSCVFLDWVYGTGCAEPRLSRAINAGQYEALKSLGVVR